MAVAEARRVGLFRALLVSHMQMMWNRIRRGLGRRGAIGVVLVLGILFAASLPLFFGFGVVGYACGTTLDKPLVAPLMGLFLANSALGFGVMGGLLGSARQLTWDAYRSFPVPFRTLFFAETVAGLGDLVLFVFVGVHLTLVVAFAWGARQLLPVLFLVGACAQVVFWVLFLQNLVGSLAVSAVRRLRSALVVLAIAAWGGASFLTRLAHEMQDSRRDALIERLRTLWEEARPVIDLLPTALSVRGIVALRSGAYVRAALLQLPMLATTLLFAAMSYVILRREARPGAQRPAGGEPSDRWFRGRAWPAAWSIARLHLHYVGGSLQGRFALLVPLITVIIIRGPLLVAGFSTRYALPGAVLYVAVTVTQFQFNQFGLDGQGVKALFLLPVSMHDVLLGKALGVLAYSLVQNLLLFVLLCLVLHPVPLDVAAAALMAAGLAVAQVLEGHWLSAMYPRLLSRHRMNAEGFHGVSFLPLGAGLANSALFSGVYALAALLPPVARTAALGAMLVGLCEAYRQLLPRAARFVTERRETLVEVLG